MNTEPTPSGTAAEDAGDQPPACVLSFNVGDPSGAGGSAGDIATIAAMGAHPLPVLTGVLMRDTAEVFDQHVLEADAVVEQARAILEDVSAAAFKVGFLGSAEVVGAVAEVLSDYPEVPVVAYLPALPWVDDDEQQAYHDALRQLVLPAAEVLVGNHKTLADFLLPEWDSERAPSARELAVAAAVHGARHVLVTGIMLSSKGAQQYIDNVLASPQGALTGEKFELFEASFVGAGDTLSAALAALLAAGSELHDAVGEALSFLDQSLDAGFRPGMGNVVPDRYFWALPPADEDGGDPEGGEAATAEPKSVSRRVH